MRKSAQPLIIKDHKIYYAFSALQLGETRIQHTVLLPSPAASLRSTFAHVFNTYTCCKSTQYHVPWLWNARDGIRIILPWTVYKVHAFTLFRVQWEPHLILSFILQWMSPPAAKDRAELTCIVTHPRIRLRALLPRSFNFTNLELDGTAAKLVEPFTTCKFVSTKVSVLQDVIGRAIA